MEAYNIQWDTANKDLALPDEIHIPEGFIGGGYEVISAYLYDVIGVHHNGFLIRDEQSRHEKLPELPKCPFCNGAAKRVASKYTPDGALPVMTSSGYKFPRLTWYGVKCKDCGIEQPKRKYFTRKESDAAWMRYEDKKQPNASMIQARKDLLAKKENIQRIELTKESVLHVIEDGLLQEPGDSVTFNYGDWYLKLRREDPLYAPWEYALDGIRLNSPATWSRRYLTMEAAFLHVFNSFNENANLKDRYASLKEALEKEKFI